MRVQIVTVFAVALGLAVARPETASDNETIDPHSTTERTAESKGSKSKRGILNLGMGHELNKFDVGYAELGEGFLGISQHVPVPYPVHVKVPVDRPVPYHLSVPYSVPVEKHVPYLVEKLVPYPVKVPIQVPVTELYPVPIHVKVLYPVEKEVPYPVKVPYVVKESYPMYVHDRHHEEFDQGLANMLHHQ